MTLIISTSGIRGTIGGQAQQGLTPIDLVNYTKAYAQYIQQNPAKEYLVVVGRDARLSGEMCMSLVTGTLQSMGIHVRNIGLAPTPTVAMEVLNSHADGGIIITASHNPMEWNALKLLNHAGEFIDAKALASVKTYAADPHTSYADIEHLGTCTIKHNSLEEHIQEILKLRLVNTTAIAQADFWVGVDGINSVGGTAVPMLLEALGVEHIVSVHDEPHGRFAHPPEPLPEHLTALCGLVSAKKLDIGIAVDPDVDRVTFITEQGVCFGEEFSLVAIADYVLTEEKGVTVNNLSSSRALEEVAKKHGVKHFYAAVGEANVVACMKKELAVIGGEGNGGIIYPELHYGRDALVGIALLLSHLAVKKISLSELRKEYADYVMIKEKISLPDSLSEEALYKQLAQQYKEYSLNTADGLRIDFSDGSWVHVRGSRTEPIVRIYIEAANQQACQTLLDNIRTNISLIQ